MNNELKIKVDAQVGEKCIAIVSGGLDSVTMLYWAIDQGYIPYVINFNYGQRHVREVEDARKICEELNVDFKQVNVSAIKDLMYTGALMDDKVDVPEEHYEHESQKLTVVANRNAIFINLAVAYAITVGANKIFYAAHWNDRAIYPDCRWEFVEAQNITAKLANDKPELEVIAPFIHKTKADIVAIGTRLGVPFEKTWSCYKGGDIACGVCGTCQERIEAFELNDLVDPILYPGEGYKVEM